MINRQALLSDLQRLLQRLEADLLERSESTDVPDVGQALRAEFERAKTAERTAQNYEDWRSDNTTQAAAAWVLSCVFVRFLEDNRLIDPPKLSGPTQSLHGNRLQRARDEHELYFRAHPQQTDRDYLLAVFNELAKLPGTKDVFGEHNPMRELPNWLSGDAAGELLRFFQKIEANTGTLVHDFTDPNWDTRFLGDLYQDLSEAARKKYALLQTPVFVEEFILDRTLDPALEEFGLNAPPLKDSQGKPLTEPGFRMIDPACGSGHFLLGAFPRILSRWQQQEPGTNVRELVQRALDSVYGVDVNPYAVAIARFRLLLAAMRACGITRLADCPAFDIHIACGDSLYHGRQRQLVLGESWTAEDHYFRSEDATSLRAILSDGTYHCVVANPPYITPTDNAANKAYRKLYSSCHKSYSLAVPFMERIFQLAVRAEKSNSTAGYTGQITANSFAKAEFGKKLVEHFLPTVELTHVIDSSGACIPGHSTPTFILFGRNRKPLGAQIRTVMGVQGDPETPEIPSKGPVWLAIIGQVDVPNSTSEFISVQDVAPSAFHRHPWSIGGGGATELTSFIESKKSTTLDSFISEIGRTTHTGEDSAYSMPIGVAARSNFGKFSVPFIDGDAVRDFVLTPNIASIFPYEVITGSSVELTTLPKSLQQHFWRLRVVLRMRRDFGEYIEDRGLQWFEHSMFFPERYRNKRSLAYAFVATHNHFVFDLGGKLFNRPAPAIKLPDNATQIDFEALLGTLNSSVACFWIKQFTQVKTQVTGMDSDAWRLRRQLNGTTLKDLPVALPQPAILGGELERRAKRLVELTPEKVIEQWARRGGDPQHPLHEQLANAKASAASIRGEMILLQEDLDWESYYLYGLASEKLKYEGDPFPIQLGQRAFEIVLARKLASGKVQSTWFEKHQSVPITEMPNDWPDEYRQLVRRRIEAIESNCQLALIEQPEYKRRWNSETWELQLKRALREWLHFRLESYVDFDGRMNDEGKPTAQVELGLVSIAKLTDFADHDPDFHQVGSILQADIAFDVRGLVAELVEEESVPLLPILRYKSTGLRKRAVWESTWDLQRREDAGETVGVIPAPPKYDGEDFVGADYNRLRGKLDVPKERWVSFPHCEGPDGTPVIAWAGYDHLQLARAIAEYYGRVQTEFGGSDDPRLVPLLACLVELLPWLKQWHNEPDAGFDGLRMGDYFEGFLTEEARRLGKTIPEIKAWTPPTRAAGKGRRRANT